MSILTAIILFAAGLALLVKGADWLVNGASELARRLGVLDLTIGLTIVAFGTSMPELIVNIIASVNGNADIAIGNILGSNIANILLILGISAALAPLAIQGSTVLKEIPFAVLASLVLFVTANDEFIDGFPSSELGRGDGIVFIGFFIIFLYYTFGMRRNGPENGHTKATKSVLFSSGEILVGLLALGFGGKLAVDAAVSLALLLGVSEALVGLTAVAVGTSLPELATSTVAAVKGKADIAVGNIVGSNIFNIFWILGISALIRPLPFDTARNFDLTIVLLSAVFLFFIVHNGNLHRRIFLWWRQERDYAIRRWEGWMLLLSYIGYVVYIGWRG